MRTIRELFIESSVKSIHSKKATYEEMKSITTTSLSEAKELDKREKVNDGERTIARIAGILFIVATLASLVSTAFLTSINSSNYLTEISANKNSVMTGVLFAVIGAAACAGIAISLYPVLRKYSSGLALGAVGFRLVEGALYLVGAIGLISLVTLSQEFVKSGSLQSSSYFQTLGLLMLNQYHWVSFGAAPFFFGIGAFMYYVIFHQTRLVPRWLSDWGIVGASLCVLTSVIVMVGLLGPFSTIQVVLVLPIGVQEMVLATWLIVKGFQNTGARAISMKGL